MSTLTVATHPVPMPLSSSLMALEPLAVEVPLGKALRLLSTLSKINRPLKCLRHRSSKSRRLPMEISGWMARLARSLQALLILTIHRKVATILKPTSMGEWSLLWVARGSATHKAKAQQGMPKLKPSRTPAIWTNQDSTIWASKPIQRRPTRTTHLQVSPYTLPNKLCQDSPSSWTRLKWFQMRS